MTTIAVPRPSDQPDRPDEPDDIRRAQLLERQFGVLHRRDLTLEDLRIVRREVGRGRWRRINRDVVVVHNGPLTADQATWAALLAAPTGSAISGLTAAELDGLRGFPSAKIHVTIPCGSRAAVPDDVVVHYSRFLDSDDVHPIHRPRRTRIARSLLDAASWAKSDDLARALMLAGVQQRLVTPSPLAEALPRRAHCLRRNLIAESIDDAAGGIASVPEMRFDRIVTMFRLPTPTRQAVLNRVDGRAYLDADWDDFALSAEVDGIPHMDVLRWDADLDRANEIAIGQRTILRFTSHAVRHKTMRVGSTLTRALQARGWRPS